MMRRERTGLRDSESVASFIAGVAGLLVFGLSFSYLTIFIPVSSTFVDALISAAFMLLCSSLIFRGIKRAEIRRRAKASNEYREMMEAETQKKIDEMLRNNSNVPVVEKEQ